MQKEVVTRIINEFTVARRKNPQYSLRAFARKLQVQPSALSEIMNNKRIITKKMASRILDGLCVNPVEKKSLLEEELSNEESNISLKYFKVMSDWYYFAVLSLAEIPEFKYDPKWVAERLNISIVAARRALHKLTMLNMLTEGPDGKYIPTGIQYRTPTDIIDASLKSHTLQSLELAKDSLFCDPVSKRDFSTVTMAIDTENIIEAKKMIKIFRKRLSRKLEQGNKKEVYKLAIQLFPLSGRGK